jgi:CheY-like chemotaxis protein
LEAAVLAAERAKMLVQQILAFSRQQTQHMKVLDLGPLVSGAVQHLQPLVPEGVTLATPTPNPPMWVLADAEQLRQVVTHLCTNAWQALAGGGGKVAVSVSPGTHGGATLTVRDTGPGMSTEVLARVFEPFFSTKAHTSGGSGLGLAVVHGIVKAHQGSIGVHSAPGKGSRFEVWLPEVKAEAPRASDAPMARPPSVRAEPARAPSPVAVTPGVPLSRHVVYIDDYEAMVYLISRMLKKHGVRVSAFERTEDALALIRANPAAVDLLVTDYNMPGMSGLDVVRQVKGWAPGLPVVITSGHVTPGMSAEAQSVGVLQVLNKQDSVEELATRIARLVQQLPVRP